MKKIKRIIAIAMMGGYVYYTQTNRTHFSMP